MKDRLLTDSEREQIRGMIRADGEAKSAARLGVHYFTQARALAGLPLYRATAFAIRARLQQLTAESSSASPEGRPVP